MMSDGGTVAWRLRRPWRRRRDRARHAHARAGSGDPRRARPCAGDRRGDPRRRAATRSTRSRRRPASSRTIPISTPAADRSSPIQGTNEMDAAIMDGRDRAAGAVTGVTATRNPVSLARAVMEKSPHVFLSREGADQFSREQDLEQAAPEWFATEERRRQLEEMKAHARRLVRRGDEIWHGRRGRASTSHGHVAAATSTGGLTGKRWGRIGDSPIDRRRHLCRRPRPARSRRPERANISSAPPSPTKSAPGCGCRRERWRGRRSGDRRHRRAGRHRRSDRRRRRMATHALAFNTAGMYRGLASPRAAQSRSTETNDVLKLAIAVRCSRVFSPP